jgi:hypothetical protein
VPAEFDAQPWLRRGHSLRFRLLLFHSEHTANDGLQLSTRVNSMRNRVTAGFYPATGFLVSRLKRPAPRSCAVRLRGTVGVIAEFTKVETGEGSDAFDRKAVACTGAREGAPERLPSGVVEP